MDVQELGYRSFESAVRIAELQFRSQIDKVRIDMDKNPGMTVEYPVFPSLEDIKVIANNIIEHVNATPSP